MVRGRRRRRWSFLTAPALLLAGCTGGGSPAHDDPGPSPAASSSPSLAIEDPDAVYRDDTTYAEAVEAVDLEGTAETPITWDLEDADDPLIETAQYAFVLTRMSSAAGATPRPDLVSGLVRNDYEVALDRARNYVVDGDPDGVLEGPLSISVWRDDTHETEGGSPRVNVCVDADQATRGGEATDSMLWEYRIAEVDDSDGTRVRKVEEILSVPAPSAESPDAQVRRCHDWVSR